MAPPELKSLDDWWKYMDANWDAVNSLLVYYLPPSDYEEAVRLHETKTDHHRLVKLLEDAWWNLPDNKVIHTYEGFYPLCDLCGEFQYSW